MPAATTTRRSVLAAFPPLLAAGPALAQRSSEPRSHVGTWRLASVAATDAAGKTAPPPYGPQPMGQLVLSENRRMMIMLCDGRAEIPAGEKRNAVFYSGNYTFEEDRLNILVDAASLPSLVGTNQARRLEIRGNRLLLIPPRKPDGGQNEVFFERAGAA